jgi:hypothetical protein
MFGHFARQLYALRIQLYNKNISVGLSHSDFGSRIFSIRRRHGLEKKTLSRFKP